MYYHPPQRRLKRRPARPTYRARIGRSSGKVRPIRRRRAKNYTRQVLMLLLIVGLIGYFAFKAFWPLVPAGCPKLDKPYVALACQDALDAGIDQARFVRQINQESGFNLAEVSSAGAIGIAQFMPATAAGMGINPWNPEEALRAAAQYMARLQTTFGGDPLKALAAYNAGTGTIQSAIHRCGLSWQNCLPAETMRYLHAIA